MNRLVVILVAVFSWASTGCFAQNLSLSIRIDSSVFIESQDVWATVSITNNSSIVQHIRRSSLSNEIGGLRFLLHDTNGKRIPPSGDLIDGDWSQLEILPQDSVEESYNITGEFNTSGNIDPPVYLPTMHYLKAGVYLLDAYTFTGRDTLRAARVQFEVRRPEDQEARILQALRGADSSYAADRKESLEKYKSVLELYPHSIFVPYVYSRLIFIYRWIQADQPREFELLERFADQYPNSTRALKEMRGYIPELVKFNRRSVIESLARDHPNTKVGRFCQRTLQEMNK